MYWVSARMGLRAARLSGVFAATLLMPAMGIGYYFAHPNILAFAGKAEAHANEPASSSHARTPHAQAWTALPIVPRAADHLFRRTVKGPRADRYAAVAQTSTVAKQPVRVAALVPGDGDITGSLPRQDSQRGAVNRRQKADRIIPPVKKLSGLPPPPLDTRPSASLFLASLRAPLSYKFPGAATKAAGNEADRPPKGPTKLPRGLLFKGETEAEYQARQRRCLASAIYFESRGEPVRGQLAVAQVVMNRVRSSIYPDTICGVVFQGQWRRRGCQFSFACDGHADVPRDKERWLLANKLAKDVTDGKVWLPEIGHASHYHATYVAPAWRRQMNRIKRVGRHIFYRVRYPQIEDVLSEEENQEPSLALSKSG